MESQGTHLLAAGLEVVAWVAPCGDGRPPIHAGQERFLPGHRVTWRDVTRGALAHASRPWLLLAVPRRRSSGADKPLALHRAVRLALVASWLGCRARWSLPR